MQSSFRYHKRYLPEDIWRVFNINIPTSYNNMFLSAINIFDFLRYLIYIILGRSVLKYQYQQVLAFFVVSPISKILDTLLMLFENY